MANPKNVDEKVDEILKGVGRLFEISVETGRKVARDITEKIDQPTVKGEPAAQKKGTDVESLYNNDLFKALYGSLKAAAKGGRAAVNTAAHQFKLNYDDQLDTLLQKNPKMTGMIDGFYSVFANDQPNRARKVDYQQGVGVGKALGWGASATLFVAGGVVAKVVAATPIIVRKGPDLVDYLRKKGEEARADVDKRYSNPEKK